MTDVSAETWTQLATVGSAGTAAPPPTRSLNLNDKLALAELNFGDFQDPDYRGESSAMLQAFLDYAGNYALALKERALDDQNVRSYVRAKIPRGYVSVSHQIVVPEWVDLDMEGTLIRMSGGPLEANAFLPMIVYTANSSASRVNLYCVFDDAPEKGTGAGVCFGKSWTVASVSLASAGNGYEVGDIIYLPQPSYYPYQPAVVRVDAVDISGSITSFTLTESGHYSCRPPDGPTVSASAIAGVAPNVTALVQPDVFVQDSTTHADGSPGDGLGASFTPTWVSDFGGSDADFGVWNYNAGDALGSDMVIGQVRVNGVGIEFDSIYGGKFGVLLNTINGVIDSITVNGGYYGILSTAGDIRANSLNPVNSMIGLMFGAGSSFECPNVVVDTPFGAAIQIDAGCVDIKLKGICFFPEGNNSNNDGIGPTNTGYAVIIGQKGVADFANHIHLDLALDNCGSATQNDGAGAGALFLANIRNSHLRIDTSNRPGLEDESHKVALHTGYASGVDAESVLVTGTINEISGASVAAGAAITDAEIVFGGSGYAAGDIVALNVPDHVINATALVTETSTGVVTAIKLLGPGLYSSVPSTTTIRSTTTTFGGGSGLTVKAKDVLAVGSISGGLAIRDGGLPGWIRDFGICEIYGSVAPTSSTGINKAPTGSRYVDGSTGDTYYNKGTAGAPVWYEVTTS